MDLCLDLAALDLGALDLGALDLAALDLGALDLGALDLGTLGLGALYLGALELVALLLSQVIPSSCSILCLCLEPGALDLSSGLVLVMRRCLQAKILINGFTTCYGYLLFHTSICGSGLHK